MGTSHESVAVNAIRCCGLPHACARFANNSVASLSNSAGAKTFFAGALDQRGWSVVMHRKAFSKSHFNYPFFKRWRKQSVRYRAAIEIAQAERIEFA
jgi:hypothetical protein